MYINLSPPLPSSYQISQLVKHLLARLTVADWWVSVASCGQKVAAERPWGQCLYHLVSSGTKQLMHGCRSCPIIESLNTTVPASVSGLSKSALFMKNAGGKGSWWDICIWQMLPGISEVVLNYSAVSFRSLRFGILVRDARVKVGPFCPALMPSCSGVNCAPSARCSADTCQLDSICPGMG